jgi:hypothetical protein
LVVHYREEPGAKIAARLPQMTFGKRAYQRVLHEIVRPVGGSRECPRITAEPWDLLFDETGKLRHSPYSSADLAIRG